MMPTRRQWMLAGFLAVFAFGLWVLTLVPAISVLLGLGWLGAAIFAGWKLFPEPQADVRRPDLIVPQEFLTDEAAIEPVEETFEPEPVEDVSSTAVLEPVDEAVTEEAVAQDWTPVLDLLDALEAEWAKPDAVAPGLQEVSGNAAFILANVQQSYNIADNLAGSAQRAFSLSEKVQKGVTVVTDALMESLKQTEILSGHSQRITGILQLMGEVSDKIHVLSINASIVSARAGAAGRGFEVVAKEIRSLAKETEHSLGDIVEVIELLRSSIAKVIEVVRDADLETEQEKSSLIEVAGALQGVILGVEIVKAVSGFAKEKAEEQEKLFQALSAAERGPDVELRSKVAAVRARLEEWKSKE